ncbi:MAG: 5-carboxymethyl-2-hydroxymuconateDelta-isomerase [Chthoniobacteraceae bacterium]|nr:5-carboxymethyl-2-hydroxymuconateDelta-isomerase [Chthoniobacteraceae bacterium]
MQIIRYQSSQGVIGYAAQQSDGTHLKLRGELFSGLEPTEETADVAKILAPLDPAVILCIGLNYRQHAVETNTPIPVYPVVFMKNLASVQNPGDPIVLPHWMESRKVDFECELAVIIGRACKNVSRADALSYVFGYTCANDVSARDWQKEGGGSQWCRGKSFDTFCPLGPVIVTADEIPDPNALRIRTVVSGEVLQDASTSDMIFDIATLIEFLSGSTTLLPGTVILTGTPHGVGVARTPVRFLLPGDLVSIEIPQIGSLINPVIEEPASGSGSSFSLY